MFNKFRKDQFLLYQKARDHLIKHPSILISLEKFVSEYTYRMLKGNISAIKADYDEASYLYPFWQNYPPDERGRKPRGDQFPWIEVGEHVIGDKLGRLLSRDFKISDAGIPTGPDKRFILQSELIKKITDGFTDSIWFFVDIKSVGPRDDFEHTVMSHNQISGDGVWDEVSVGVKNCVMVAKGKQTKHEFHCSVPPLYILSNKTTVPVVLVAIKPVYKMLTLDDSSSDGGQPLQRIIIIVIPNGLLLEENPAYLKKFPSLFFPGKDDKEKNPLKVRSRVSFDLLKKIDDWRVRELLVE